MKEIFMLFIVAVTYKQKTLKGGALAPLPPKSAPVQSSVLCTIYKQLCFMHLKID